MRKIQESFMIPFAPEIKVALIEYSEKAVFDLSPVLKRFDRFAWKLALRFYIEELLKVQPLGGNLHIVLDDLNVDRESIEDCIRDALKKKDFQGAIIGALLLEIPEEERIDFIRDASKDINWSKIFNDL